MRFLCVINPFSGGKKGRAVIQRLQSARAAGVFDGDVIESDVKSFSSQIARAKEYDCLVIGGGDGTVSNAIQQQESMGVPLGILPLGTANDLARELGAAARFSIRAPEQLLVHYQTAEKRKLTVWRLRYGENQAESLLFLNYVSLGFDGAVIDSVARWRKNVPGIFRLGGISGNRLAYLLAGVKNLTTSRLDSCDLTELKGGRICGAKPSLRTLFVANIQCALGVGRSNLIGSPFDQTLEIVPIGSVFSYLAFVAPWLRPWLLSKLVLAQGGLQINGVRPRIRYQVDGEDRPELTGKDVRIEPAGAVEFFV